MIDWTKPIETVPDERNPVPVPCSLVGQDEHDYFVSIDGPWFCEGGVDRSDVDYWFYNLRTHSTHTNYLPELRNVTEYPASTPCTAHPALLTGIERKYHAAACRA